MEKKSDKNSTFPLFHIPFKKKILNLPYILLLYVLIFSKHTFLKITGKLENWKNNQNKNEDKLMNGDIMSFKNTTIAIDEDKLNLSKKRGIKLKSVLNDALDIVLKIENFSENSTFEIEKQDILNTLENLELQHQEHIREYEKQVNELKTRLELINGLILKSKTEYKANKQKDDYNEIITSLDKSLGDVESNPIAKQLIETYCMRYNIPDDDDFFEKVNQDYIRYIQAKSKR